MTSLLCLQNCNKHLQFGREFDGVCADLGIGVNNGEKQLNCVVNYLELEFERLVRPGTSLRRWDCRHRLGADQGFQCNFGEAEIGLTTEYLTTESLTTKHPRVGPKRLQVSTAEHLLYIFLTANYWVGPLTVLKLLKDTPRSLSGTPWKNLTNRDPK